jgi:hypothetical protein
MFCAFESIAHIRPHLVVLLMIVHMLLGFRRLREVDYYRDDPLVLV